MQIEGIKEAKLEMNKILKAQKAQQKVVGIPDAAEEQDEEPEGKKKEYFNKFLMRPLLDF